MSYGYTPYFNPMATPQQRLAQMEQMYPQFAQPQMPMQQQAQTPQAGQIAKASLVMTKEEALAQQVPDYAMGVFVNKAANEVYIKKLGNDGLPEFKTYNETVINNVTNPEVNTVETSTNKDIKELKAQIEELKADIEELKNDKSDADVSNNKSTKKQS